ncbi:VraH family peptide resistance protein [Staphylococcus pasteuri]
MEAKAFILIVVAIILISMTFTPIIGIPVGLAIGVYISENDK